MNFPSDIIERITLAANELFEAAGRQQFPTVDQVRRTARVDMNAASVVMRDWRREQTARPVTASVHVPDSLIEASQTALVAIWQQAQELANENLRTAQVGWENERAELDGLRAEVSQAFDAVESQLQMVQSRADAAAQEYLTASQVAAQELIQIREALTESQARAQLAEVKSADFERRAEELQKSLRKAEQLLKSSADELAAARERAAGLEGKVEAITSQNAALLACIPVVEKTPTKRKTSDG